MPLCHKCTQFFNDVVLTIGIAGITPDYLHHGYLTEFLQAVDDKCFVCWRIFRNSFDRPAKARTLLWKIAQATSSDGREAEREWLSMQRRLITSIYGSSVGDGDPPQNRLWPKWNTDYLEALKVCHRDIVHLMPDIVAAEQLIKRDNTDDNGRAAGSFFFVSREPSYLNSILSPCTDSDETLETVRRWVTQCEATHTNCREQRRSSSWYPTRLLDIGPTGSTAVKLVPGTEASVAGTNYMTLSHRWGASTILTLKASVLQDWAANGLPVQKLSKTFADFISLSRRLSVRYVWIDSLCIIQDGDGGADWRAEALTMDKVYAHAYCNISADWGSDARGLFFPRDVRMMEAPAIDMQVKREGSDAPVLEKCLLVENEFWQDQVSRSPLNDRGWVVQERWLSARNVRFGPREVFFECGQHTLCERFPETLPHHLCEGDVVLKATAAKFTPVKGPAGTALGPATPGTPLYEAWEAVLCKYSKCHLTYASDHLVAFAGIAKSFRGILDDVYVAGLWLRNLASDMMWYRGRLATTAVIDDAQDYAPLFSIQPPGQYLAPSFSWASSGVPIQVHHVTTNLGFLVDPICIKYRATGSDLIVKWTQDIYGPMSGPMVEIMVVGSLRKMRLLPYYDDTCTDVYVVPDGPTAKYKDLQPWSKDLHRNAREATLDFQISNTDLEAFVARDDYYYMPWQSQFDPWVPEEPNKPRTETFTCLLLQLEDSSMGRFRRIGRLWTHKKQDRDVCLMENGNEDVLPCAEYNPDTKRHKIYVT